MCTANLMAVPPLSFPLVRWVKWQPRLATTQIYGLELLSQLAFLKAGYCMKMWTYLLNVSPWWVASLMKFQLHPVICLFFSYYFSLIYFKTNVLFEMILKIRHRFFKKKYVESRRHILRWSPWYSERSPSEGFRECWLPMVPHPTHSGMLCPPREHCGLQLMSN